MFNHNLLELPKLERIDGEYRYYELPTGERYPSVTTVLGNTKTDTAGLDNWRKRVGKKEAQRQTNRAGVRGTAVHNLCEKFVLNEEISFMKEMPLNVQMFKQIKKVLELNVDNILVSEGFLYSHYLKVAGAVDLIAEWKGIPAIIDFKTSRANKREEWITDYYLQTSMYSFMFWEMTKRMHSKIAIIIACEEELEAQVFETDASMWIEEAKRRCKLFHKTVA